MKKRVAYSLLGVVTAIAGLLGFTARTRYQMPPPDATAKLAELVPVAARRDGQATVVMLVFDGFGPSVARVAKTPNLDRIAKSGAHTIDMMPVFPSLSMPNHFSLSTGCYPEHHGVVSNHFRDDERGIFAQRADADWLLACEPLHVVAERQGVRAAVFGHVAATSTRHGKLASIAVPFTEPDPTAEMQIDRVLEQLRLPLDRRPRLIIGYVTQPDRNGHKYGPTAPETIAAVEHIDTQIGRVMAEIDKTRATERTTLIVTSDHGMVAANEFVSVERLLRKASIEATVLAEGSLAHIYLDRPTEKAATIAALARYPFLDVIDPLHAPASLHIGSSAHGRYGDVLVSLHKGAWTADSGLFPWYLRWLNFIGEGKGPSSRFPGMHGYDPERVPEVHAIFFAWGSAIATLELQGMRTIDVHPTIAYLLGIAPGTPVDGRARTEILAAAEPAAVAAEPAP